jgi:hypothetical protein
MLESKEVQAEQVDWTEEGIMNERVVRGLGRNIT